MCEKQDRKLKTTTAKNTKQREKRAGRIFAEYDFFLPMQKRQAGQTCFLTGSLVIFDQAISRFSTELFKLFAQSRK